LHLLFTVLCIMLQACYKKMAVKKVDNRIDVQRGSACKENKFQYSIRLN
jgi:hypothetical protein